MTSFYRHALKKVVKIHFEQLLKKYFLVLREGRFQQLQILTFRSETTLKTSNIIRNKNYKHKILQKND